ncbi:citrate synthase [Dermacoccus nishinomiyaensis]|uniref:citrate synthase n=1 Tax=Dermacoccus nishinomiyaensis TaxID=1274 RepID=UPI000938CF88|nr:citrate synthase [Dermacoccus nishinomiyaensis]HCQ19683.1 citrate synthase [Dermacoccus sp.]
MTSQGNATFTADDKELEFPIVEAVEGCSGYDISALMKETGNVTLDVGFVNTASCKSAITYIDGDQGILRYRGYPIDQIAENASFLEVAALLIDGELPSQARLDEITQAVAKASVLPEGLEKIFDAFPKGAHPMLILASVVPALGTYYADALSVKDDAAIDKATAVLLGAVPTLAAYSYRKSIGESFIAPDASLGYVENFLHMMFGGDVDQATADALDMLFTLHGDHEQNCSASTVRMVGSAEADLFQSITAGIGALSGPLHGGANSAVLEMLEKIQSTGDSAEDFMDKVKNKVDGVKLMGFGHRVYKSYDPRAAIVKKATHSILEKNGKDEQLELAMGLEERALKDDYFVQRKLYPNVDFYTGLIYKSMGFPTNMFTVLFAIGRMPGWIAQWREQNKDAAKKIGRPRQVYVGATERDYPTK